MDIHCFPLGHLGSSSWSSQALRKFQDASFHISGCFRGSKLGDSAWLHRASYPQQTRTGCFRVTTGLNKRVEAPTRRLLTSFCLDDVCCCPTGPIEPQVRIIVGEMIQVVDTERHRSLEPFYISLPQNLLSRSST